MSSNTEEKVTQEDLEHSTPKKPSLRKTEPKSIDNLKLLQSILQKCRIYFSRKQDSQSSSEEFANLIGEHISIDVIPKPLTSVGILLAESGVFLLAYAKFQAERNQIEKQALLKTYETMVKTQKENFLKRDASIRIEKRKSTLQQNPESSQEIPNQKHNETTEESDTLFEPVVRHQPKKKRFQKTSPQKQYRATCYRKNWTIIDQMNLMRAYLKHFDNPLVHKYVARQISRSPYSITSRMSILRVKYPKTEDESYYDQARNILAALEKIYIQQRKQKAQKQEEQKEQ